MPLSSGRGRGLSVKGKGKEKENVNVFSRERVTTLLASLLVALCSGTNYVYSAYAPQLGERLHISHTQLNVVAVAGNVGVYITGPILGRLVDTRGPQILIFSGSILLFLGYGGIKTIYDLGLPPDASPETTLPFGRFVLLVLCSFLTGAGGDAGLMSAVNTTAKSFPEHARASSTGLVISGFGLSAFLFSTIAHTFFAGNTTAFLGILTLGTSLPMILGFFFVRVIPLPHPHSPKSPTEGADDEEEHLLREEGPVLVPRHPHMGAGATPTFEVDLEQDLGKDLERDEEGIEMRALSGGGGGAASKSKSKKVGGLGVSITRGKLWRTGDFWLLFGILSLVSGTGLMYINNIGSMCQALLAHANDSYTTLELTSWQSAQVSYISVFNFLGRVVIGLLSDTLTTHLHLPRSALFTFTSLLLLFSQLAAYTVTSIERLFVVSVPLGLAYGSVFSLAPVVCMEWFGVEHLSENWGYLAISPMFSGNIFSLIFGRNLDMMSGAGGSISIKHPSPPSSSPSTHALQSSQRNSMRGTAIRRGLGKILTLLAGRDKEQCLLGNECYRGAVVPTIVAALVAFGLSCWAWVRERRKRR